MCIDSASCHTQCHYLCSIHSRLFFDPINLRGQTFGQGLAFCEGRAALKLNSKQHLLPNLAGDKHTSKLLSGLKDSAMNT